MSNKSTTQQIAEHLEHFVVYISSPWRLVWINFLAGIFRGLGAIIGAGVVLAILFWVLNIFANFPLIGQFVTNFKNEVNSYVKETNYKEDFLQINQTLKKIETKITDK